MPLARVNVMTRKHLCLAVGRKFALVGVLVLATQVLAVDPNVERGKLIFQHEWKFTSLPKLDQGDLSRHDFERQLRALPGDGLGPMFNAVSCEACHAGGGASGVEHNVTLLTLDPRSTVLKVTNDKERTNANKQAILELYPGLIAPNGRLAVDVVVHESSSRPLFQLVRDQIAEFVPRGISDDWYKSPTRKSSAIADRPVIAGRKGEIDFYLSQRNSPPLFGMGTIDLIDHSTLLRIARLQSRRTGGRISGRIGVGKFGWRGQTPSLDAFVRGACAGELGLQLPGTPQPPDTADETYVSLGNDLVEPQVRNLVSYVRSLPEPRQETKLPSEAKQIREGKRWFAKSGLRGLSRRGCHAGKGNL